MKGSGVTYTFLSVSLFIYLFTYNFIKFPVYLYLYYFYLFSCTFITFTYIAFTFFPSGEECKRSAAQLAKTYPDNTKPAMIEVAQYCKDKQVTKAIEALQVNTSLHQQPQDFIWRSYCFCICLPYLFG